MPRHPIVALVAPIGRGARCSTISARRVEKAGAIKRKMPQSRQSPFHRGRLPFERCWSTEQEKHEDFNRFAGARRHVGEPRGRVRDREPLRTSPQASNDPSCDPSCHARPVQTPTNGLSSNRNACASYGRGMAASARRSRPTKSAICSLRRRREQQPARIFSQNFQQE
jgi:hypothetical protein